MKKDFFKIVAFVALLALVFSCSEYSRIVKDDNYTEKLEKAEELYASGSYNRALVLYEQVYQRHPADNKGELSYFKLGMTYFQQKDYFMSAYYFGQFPARFPKSNRVQDAIYHSAVSSFKTSPSHTLDQEDTEAALSELQYYVSRYPNSPRVDSCNMMMSELRQKLEDKAWEAVLMYDRMERYNAAMHSAQAFIQDFPNTSRKLEAAFLMMRNAYILADKSVFSKKRERYERVIEIYDLYRDEFQMSRYIGDAMNYFERAQNGLEEVEEVVMFDEIETNYERAQRASQAKKVEYLEETLKLYYNFAQRYPNSSYMSRAEEIFRRAERERQNTYSY
jgi:outer membrane protein assembly factor BamD